jgi:hypothetical protein
LFYIYYFHDFTSSWRDGKRGMVDIEEMTSGRSKDQKKKEEGN